MDSIYNPCFYRNHHGAPAFDGSPSQFENLKSVYSPLRTQGKCCLVQLECNSGIWTTPYEINRTSTMQECSLLGRLRVTAVYFTCSRLFSAVPRTSGSGKQGNLGRALLGTGSHISQAGAHTTLVPIHRPAQAPGSHDSFKLLPALSIKLKALSAVRNVCSIGPAGQQEDMQTSPGAPSNLRKPSSSCTGVKTTYYHACFTHMHPATTTLLLNEQSIPLWQIYVALA